MASRKLFDLVVIGGGPGGYVSAIKAAQLGLRTACIEGRGTLGGTCLNVGCIPSKALLHTSHMFDHVSHMGSYGIDAEASLDLGKMMSHKNKLVSGLTKGIEHLFKKNGVEYIQGWASLDGDQVLVNDETIDAKNVLLATGSTIPEFPPCPVDHENVLDSTDALSLQEVPSTMAVIGGGVIGLELGSVWNRLGSDVTVFEYSDRILPGMCPDVTGEASRILKKQGLNILTGHGITESNGTTLHYNDGSTDQMATFDKILVCTGRVPNLDSIKDSVALDAGGTKVKVDQNFQTSVPNVYAIGDIIDGPMLAHKAEKEGMACVERLASDIPYDIDFHYDTIPNVVYTHPEIASVGISEEEAIAKSLDYKVGKFPFMANSRARVTGESDGFVKYVSDSKTDTLLGAQVIGPNAGDLIMEAVITMEYGGTTEDIGRTCHAHPSVSEAMKEAALDAWQGNAIHV